MIMCEHGRKAFKCRECKLIELGQSTKTDHAVVEAARLLAQIELKDVRPRESVRDWQEIKAPEMVNAMRHFAQKSTWVGPDDRVFRHNTGIFELRSGKTGHALVNCDAEELRAMMLEYENSWPGPDRKPVSETCDYTKWTWIARDTQTHTALMTLAVKAGKVMSLRALESPSARTYVLVADGRVVLQYGSKVVARMMKKLKAERLGAGYGMSEETRDKLTAGIFEETPSHIGLSQTEGPEVLHRETRDRVKQFVLDEWDEELRPGFFLKRDEARDQFKARNVDSPFEYTIRADELADVKPPVTINFRCETEALTGPNQGLLAKAIDEQRMFFAKGIQELLPSIKQMGPGSIISVDSVVPPNEEWDSTLAFDIEAGSAFLDTPCRTLSEHEAQMAMEAGHEVEVHRDGTYSGNWVPAALNGDWHMTPSDLHMEGQLDFDPKMRVEMVINGICCTLRMEDHQLFINDKPMRTPE